MGGGGCVCVCVSGLRYQHVSDRSLFVQMLQTASWVVMVGGLAAGGCDDLDLTSNSECFSKRMFQGQIEAQGLVFRGSAVARVHRDVSDAQTD